MLSAARSLSLSPYQGSPVAHHKGKQWKLSKTN